MRKILVLIIILGLTLPGCSWFKKGGKGSVGISKAESKAIAMEYMAGTEPCGFANYPTTYAWDFRMRREGKIKIVTIFVDKKSGLTVNEIGN